MRTFTVALMAATASASLNMEYMQYVINHSKSYITSAEFEMRKNLYAISDDIINEHNATNSSFTLGHNFFSDMTEEQKANTRGRLNQKVEGKVVVLPESNGTSLDWRTQGAVNEIQDQGACGSCWAFSAVCSLEAAHWKTTGTLLKFAEQQLVDCAGIRYGNFGCNGGLQQRAYKYYESYGAMLEADYPYTAKDGSCAYDADLATNVEVSDFSLVTPDSESQTLAAIDLQPIAVSIEADKAVFQLYKTGVFDSPKCGTQLDHAVALVGYGTDNGQDYYILRNSWGTSWGEDGYMRIARTGDDAGICGVQSEPLYPASN